MTPHAVNSKEKLVIRMKGKGYTKDVYFGAIMV